MTKLTIAEGKLNVEVEGWDKLWSLRSRLEIPLQDVVRVYPDREIAKAWWQGLRVVGTHVPGVITAGTFYHHGNWIFWDVHDPEKTIVIDLRHERYAKLIVVVESPAETVAAISAHLAPA